IGLSGSGMSPNVINAFHVANQAGAVSILLSGFDGGNALKAATDAIVVPSSDMQQIEDVHMILTHIIFRCLKREIAES
ncbi:MAG: phosphoheptose isomerase, partial [Candidatus Fermentibacteria bacterium]|nr:phosphoheptose isomerase [Candidatus Fermentibacteria bacterium]